MSGKQVEIKTPEYVSIQFQMAGLGSRAAAFIIDQALLMIVNLLSLVLLYFSLNGMTVLPVFLMDRAIPFAITILVLFIVNWGYFFVVEFFSGGRTLGKKLVGIRVIQDNGHSITLLSSFIRNLIRLIDSLPVAYLVGMIMIFFHSKHKRLGDLVAGTIVVHERAARRKKKRLSPLEKEIESRGLHKDLLHLDEWTLKSLTNKEWKLVSTYASRFHQVPEVEKQLLTRQIAEILLPKIGIEPEGKDEKYLEDSLLSLYLLLRDEWEFAR